MKKLFFSTGNAQKLRMGQSVCERYNIELIQQKLVIDEIQSEDCEYVARRKAEAAYELLGQPVLVSDDAWNIYGLNGFPGTYAKSINTWFTADDYLRLTRDLDDRRASVIQILVYQDAQTQRVFSHETMGTILKEISDTPGQPNEQVISFDPEGKLSISDMLADGRSHSTEDTVRVWYDFAEWLSKQ